MTEQDVWFDLLIDADSNEVLIHLNNPYIYFVQEVSG